MSDPSTAASAIIGESTTTTTTHDPTPTQAPPPPPPPIASSSAASTATATTAPRPGVVTIRAATPDDAAALSALASRTFVSTFGHLYPPAELAAFLRDAYAADQMRRELADPDFSTFLAFPSSSQPGDDRDEQGDSPVGFATLRRNSVKTDHAHRNPDPAAYVEVKRLYVDQAFHGSGAGRALMDCLMREVKEACAAAKQAGMGTPTVWLGVWEGNARAQRFYEKYGFREDGEHVFMVGEVRDRDLLFVLRE